MITFKLHFIRHGMTRTNAEGRYIGMTDVALSEEGREELSALRSTYEYPKVQKVYRSPLSRCGQTADILYPDSFTEIVPKLAEFDFGEFEGRSMEELKGEESYKAWITSGLPGAAPGGEDGQSFLRRIIEAVGGIIEDMMKLHITSAAVVTHGGVIMTLLAAMGVPKRGHLEYIVENGRGFTVSVSTQMWMRDRCFEVFDVIPKGERVGTNAAYTAQFVDMEEDGDHA